MESTPEPLETPEQINEANELFAQTTFCPLINTRCQPQCVCFESRREVGSGGKHAWMVGPRCGNSMFDGGDRS